MPVLLVDEMDVDDDVEFCGIPSTEALGFPLGFASSQCDATY